MKFSAVAVLSLLVMPMEAQSEMEINPHLAGFLCNL